MLHPTLPAVLWDMDGTLLDTEPLWHQAQTELVTEHGGEWSALQAHNLVGRALLDSAAIILAETDLPFSCAELMDNLLGRVAALARPGIRWRPGAAELVSELHAEGVRQGVVTATFRSLAEQLLATTPGHLLGCLVAGDEVIRGKPDPMPYLKGAQLLGLAPEECVAIEDSPTGIASAKAAGCIVVGVPSHVDLSGTDADYLVSSLAEIDMAQLAHWRQR